MQGTGTRLRCDADSHPGLVRDNNEDLYYCDPEGGVFVVIDGVGGHAAGEKAADIACGVIRSRLGRAVCSVEERLREAIALANNEIFRQAGENGAWAGMSCVLTVAVVEGDTLTVGHVGDTRLYRIHDGRIEQLTRDHSFVGELVAGGLIAEREAMRHPRRNEITRDVGSAPHQPEDPCFIDISKHRFPKGCALLLCSDGLTDSVAAEEILSLVNGCPDDPSEVVRELIGAANAAGGADNVTVVYVTSSEACAEEGDAGAAAAASLRNGRGARPRVRRALRRRVACVTYGFLLAFACWSLLLWQSQMWGKPRAASGGEARTLIVNPRNPDAYASVNDALRQARAGDVVEVEPGEYSEKITERQVFVKK